MCHKRVGMQIYDDKFDSLSISAYYTIIHSTCVELANANQFNCPQSFLGKYKTVNTMAIKLISNTISICQKFMDPGQFHFSYVIVGFAIGKIKKNRGMQYAVCCMHCNSLENV